MSAEKGVKSDFNIDKDRLRSISQLFSSFSNNDPIELIKLVKLYLSQNYSLSDNEINSLFKSCETNDILIPIDIFSSDISPAEALVMYLKDVQKLNFADMEKLLNRNQRGLWTSYKNGKARNIALPKVMSNCFVPISIFSVRNLSILEALTKHMVENVKVSTYKIAKLVNKSPSTIGSVYCRVKKKLNHEKK